jgi:hypothetical protein
MQLAGLLAPLLLLGSVTAAPACTIGVSTPGIVTLNSGGTTLSSANAGGIASVLSITDLSILSSTTITISNVRLDTTPPGFGAPVSYGATYSANWTLGSASGSLASNPSFTVPAILNVVVTVTLHNTVTSATGFNQGTYTTKTTVTCS